MTDRITNALEVANDRAEMWKARAVAAEAALAEANADLDEVWNERDEARERAEAAERRANDLADALRRIAEGAWTNPLYPVQDVARAALDRIKGP